jgi:16S rRNA (uracil1498-N3)-methyltransferase
MARLFVPGEELELARESARLNLAGDAHRYLTRVLRLSIGARVDVFDGRGTEVSTTIAAVDARRITLLLGDRRTVAPRATAPLTLLQGLPRAERMDLVVQKATELGAARVVPVRAARSAAGQQGRPERWEKIAREAARQSGRADWPTIAPIAALEDALAGLAPGGLRIVPWEEAPGARPLGGILGSATAPGTAPPSTVVMLIGPEGGLTEAEVERATAAGFVIATMGPRILRTETAAIVAMALAQAALGGLG